MENFRFGMSMILAVAVVVFLFTAIIMWVFGTSLGFAFQFTIAWLLLSFVGGSILGKHLKRNRERTF
jgi:multisubunit Na+/H+ antiporter MnhF subunit